MFTIGESATAALRAAIWNFGAFTHTAATVARLGRQLLRLFVVNVDSTQALLFEAARHTFQDTNSKSRRPGALYISGSPCKSISAVCVSAVRAHEAGTWLFHYCGTYPSKRAYLRYQANGSANHFVVV